MDSSLQQAQLYEVLHGQLVHIIASCQCRLPETQCAAHPKSHDTHILVQRLMETGPQSFKVLKRAEAHAALDQLYQQLEFGADDFLQHAQFCKSELPNLMVLLKVP